MHHQRLHNPRRGFSLLEMVLATALLAGTLAPALAVMRDAMAVSRETTVRSLLANYAVQKLEEHSAVAIGSWTNATVTGDFSADNNPTLRYSVTRSDLPANGGIAGQLMSVRVTVFEDLDGDSTADANEVQLMMRTKIAKLNTYENEES
jgi:prepilin-type N-terminal cleavage/methylation domain-containing protein